jgi:hypothetical protein
MTTAGARVNERTNDIDHDPAKFMDGYNFTGCIAGQPGVYEPLEFTYRPIDRVTERRYAARKQQVVRDQRLKDEDKEVKLALLDDEMLAGNIQTWNLVDHRSGRGEPVAVSAAALFLYFPRLRYDRLCQIVMLGGQSDQRPASSDQRPASSDATILDEENGHQPEPGDLEAAQGNSVAV